jgi:hypothetical protein
MGVEKVFPVNLRVLLDCGLGLWVGMKGEEVVGRYGGSIQMGCLFGKKFVKGKSLLAWKAAEIHERWFFIVWVAFFVWIELDLNVRKVW